MGGALAVLYGMYKCAFSPGNLMLFCVSQCHIPSTHIITHVLKGTIQRVTHAQLALQIAIPVPS